MTVTIGAKADVLIEVLPYIQQYEHATFVIKYGGAAMVEEELGETFAQDVTLLRKIGVQVVIVHGGGREVTDMAARLGIPTRFVEGQRYTDPETMGVVKMVLAGSTNKDIVARINRHGGRAVGLCGIDADLLCVRQRAAGEADLGLVGEVTGVNTGLLRLLVQEGLMPVVAPVGVDDRREAYNINADHAAAAVASHLRADKLVYLSDVAGVMAHGHLLPTLDETTARRLIDTGVISDGMIPKIHSAFAALASGVEKVHLVDGRVKHSLLLEIFTDQGVGTEIIHDAAAQEPGT